MSFTFAGGYRSTANCSLMNDVGIVSCRVISCSRKHRPKCGCHSSRPSGASSLCAWALCKTTGNSLRSGLSWVLLKVVYCQAWYAVLDESTILPDLSQVLYLSSFYRRGDLALRIGLFYTAASLSGAFGGEYPMTIEFNRTKLTK